MKTKSILASLVLILISLSAFPQSLPFNGEWKINKEKTSLPEGQLFLSKITLQVKGDTLLTNRTYEDPNGQEYPFQENLALNGAENKITIFEMPRVSKAHKNDDGSILIDSKTTFYGNGGEENLIAKEIWKTDPQTNMLTLELTNQMSGQEFKVTAFYDKVIK